MRSLAFDAALCASLATAVAAPTFRPAAAHTFQVAAVDRGQMTARRLCADCHAIERGRPSSPNPEAPTFQRIATTPGMNRTALAAFLHTPHRMMPNLVLERQEADDIIDYILSLAD